MRCGRQTDGHTLLFSTFRLARRWSPEVPFVTANHTNSGESVCRWRDP